MFRNRSRAEQPRDLFRPYGAIRKLKGDREMATWIIMLVVVFVLGWVFFGHITANWFKRQLPRR